MFKTNNKNCWEKWIKELRQPVFVAEAKQRYIIHSNRTCIQYNLGDPYAAVYLTQREADCVYHLLQERTLAQAAEILHLSTRTVEYYVNNVKRKLNCRKKQEVVEKILKTQFLNDYLCKNST